MSESVLKFSQCKILFFCLAAAALQACGLVGAQEPVRAVDSESGESGPAGPETVATGAEKGRLIQEILAQHPLIRNTARTGYEDACPVLYESLRTGNDIEYVEPILQTEDPEDPRLARYNNCRSVESGVPAQYDFFSVAMFAERHFAIYELKETTPAGVRTTELLYGEAGAIQLGGHRFGGYYEIDLEQCTYETGVAIDQRADLAKVRSNYPTGANALIRRQGKYFVVELIDSRVQSRRSPDDPTLYAMQLFERTDTGEFQGICGWRESLPAKSNQN
jgi:hypothetical protein